MESGVAPKIEPVLKRFTYWSAELDLETYGRILVRLLRPGVKRSIDLRPEERQELYSLIIPRLERMVEVVLGNGVITHQWTGNALYLIPPQSNRKASDLFQQYQRVLLAA